MKIALIILSIIAILGKLYSYIQLKKYVKTQENKEIDEKFIKTFKSKIAILNVCIIFACLAQIILVFIR